MPPRRPLPTIPDPDRPPLPAALTSAVGFLAREVTSLFRDRFEQSLAEHQLRPRQFLALQLLRDEGATSQQALGQRMGMDRTTTMQTVQSLAERGYLTREDDPTDRRVYRVTLTAKGAELATALEARLRESEAAVLAPLDPSAREAFVAALRQILMHHLGGGMSSCGTHERE